MTWMCGLGKYGNYGKQLNNIKHLLSVGAGRKHVCPISLNIQQILIKFTALV